MNNEVESRAKWWDTLRGESSYFHPRLIKISLKQGSKRNSAKSGQCLAAVKEGSPIA
jgi:hypothetical protein